MLEDLRLPEEDSVSLKEGLTPGLHSGAADGTADVLDIVVPDLPHLSNATDLDALRNEPGVRLRIARNADQWGAPHGQPHPRLFQRQRGFAAARKPRFSAAPAAGAAAAKCCGQRP
jgi:Cobyric acid synthase